MPSDYVTVSVMSHWNGRKGLGQERHKAKGEEMKAKHVRSMSGCPTLLRTLLHR